MIHNKGDKTTGLRYQGSISGLEPNPALCATWLHAKKFVDDIFHISTYSSNAKL